MSKHLLIAGTALIALSACQKNAEPAPTNDMMAETNGMAADTSMNAAADTSPITLSDADKSFLEEAIKGDIGEVQLGQLAVEKGQSAAAKSFGQTLVTDHGMHKDKLVALAGRAGMSAPTEPAKEAADNYKQLQAVAPAKFDAVLKGIMVEDHQKDIAKYQKQAEGTGPLADLARETVPTLQKHLELAKAL